MQKRKKNQRFILLVGLLLMLCVFSVSSQAVGDQKILVYVDGQRVSFPDQQPYIDSNDRTLVPVRFVSETLGADVNWNGKNQEVSVKHDAKQKDIKLWVNKENYLLNGETKTMDTSAVLTKQARVVVPLRFVSEGLGAVVKWEVIDGNGVVHNFTLGQSEEEIQAIMEQIRKEIQAETIKEIGEATNFVGEPCPATLDSSAEEQGYLIQYLKSKDELPIRTRDFILTDAYIDEASEKVVVEYEGEYPDRIQLVSDEIGTNRITRQSGNGKNGVVTFKLYDPMLDRLIWKPIPEKVKYIVVYGFDVENTTWALIAVPNTLYEGGK